MKTENTAGRNEGKSSVKRSSRFRAMASGDENAREKILWGARQVFSLHAFRAATTRMIAQEAGVDHPLIHYHFGSKEMLFEAVAEQMHDEFAQSHLACFEDIRYLPLKDGFSLYLDRLLDYCLENPEPLQLIFLNMGQIGRSEENPGYRFIPLHMEGIRQTLEDKINMRGPKEEIDRFIHCFRMLFISFISAKSYHAQSLGMDPESAKYRKWMKESFTVLFLPMLEKLTFPPEACESPEPEHSTGKKRPKQKRRSRK
jgi:AcrR family transcriptional regulator